MGSITEMLRLTYYHSLLSPGSSDAKESACYTGDARDRNSIPGQKDPLEEDMATHSSVLAWRIPWIEEPGARVYVVAESWK